MFKDVVIRETPTSKPKLIGKFNEHTNVFETTRDYRKHLLLKKNAWALDYKLLKELLLPRNSTIIIIDSRRSCVYKTNAETFYNKGEEIEYLQHRRQMCMNLELFDRREFDV